MYVYVYVYKLTNNNAMFLYIVVFTVYNVIHLCSDSAG